MNCKLVLNNMRNDFEEYLIKSGLKSVVLGVSGGIDCALVAAIAKPVCEKLKVRLIGVSLPTENNKIRENIRAVQIIKYHCMEECKSFIDDLCNVAYRFCNSIDKSRYSGGSFEDKIDFGNITARCRMILLYSVAYRERGMVLSTDNLTEYYLGFWTLHGDVGDYGMIQNLWKTEVYELSNWICKNELKNNVYQSESLRQCIEAVPTDGLGITESDLDQICAKTYAEVDIILAEYFSLGKHKDHPVIQRHLKSEFKRHNPLSISREDLFRRK
jgi:NAD+ synthetase